MKALTIWQPWASLVALGHKRIESRSWGTEHRGSILIHSARNGSHPAHWRDQVAIVNEQLRDAGRSPLPSALPMGRVVAVANLVDCEWGCCPADELESEFGNYGPGHWGWKLEHVVPLAEPIEWKGKQGLWDVPADLFGLVYGQVFAESPEFRELATAMAQPAAAETRQGRLF